MPSKRTNDIVFTTERKAPTFDICRKGILFLTWFGINKIE